MKKIIFLRTLCVFLIVLGTTSCGFTPVYKAGSKTGYAFSELFVADPGSDRNNYLFVVEMEERIGRNENGSMLLQYQILITEQTIGNFEGERLRLIGLVNYQVMSIAENRLIFSGSQDNFVGFSPEETFRRAATEGARERLISSLADQVIAELTAHFSSPLFE